MVFLFLFYPLEERKIQDYYPKVVSETQGDHTLNITLQNMTKLYEGSLFLVVAPFTQFDQRIDLGNFSTSSNKASGKLKSSGRGIYQMYISYYHPNSVELRSMFQISQEVNITYTGVSSIELVSNQDIFYINSLETVTLKLGSPENLHLSDLQLNSVKCKLDKEIVPTVRLADNQFQCSVSSNKSTNLDLSMIYDNSDAYNQEIILSSAPLKIIFIGSEIILFTSQKKLICSQFLHLQPLKPPEMLL
jgi:hypothetical protein